MVATKMKLSVKKIEVFPEGDYIATVVLDGIEHKATVHRNSHGWFCNQIDDQKWRYGTAFQPFANWAGQCALPLTVSLQSFFENWKKDQTGKSIKVSRARIAITKIEEA